jgi:hypothetical protein
MKVAAKDWNQLDCLESDDVLYIRLARSLATSMAISMARAASGEWVRRAGQCRTISRAGDGRSS